MSMELGLKPLQVSVHAMYQPTDLVSKDTHNNCENDLMLVV